MLSNGTPAYKIRSSKFYGGNNNDHGYGTTSQESYDRETYEKGSHYSRDRGYSKGSSGFNKNKPRSAEFRSSGRGGGYGSGRGSSGHYRGGRRGGDYRGDYSRRDYYDSGYHGGGGGGGGVSGGSSSNRKYENANNRNGDYRKYYEPEKKGDIKLNLPEDTRISKLLRRLSNERSNELFSKISKKLLEVLLLPDNAAYIRKSFHILGDSIMEILHVAPTSAAKIKTSRVLGRMGYVMGQEGDFLRYHNWIFSKVNRAREPIQILLINSLKETCAMEKKKPILSKHVEKMINDLAREMERTDHAEIFKALLEILILIVTMYPEEFHNHFRDTIDLLFGWHVDHQQPLATIEFVSKSLQKLSNHFKCHLESSVVLVQNFLEDITNYSKDLKTSNQKNTVINHVIVLILALNTVLKCLDTHFHPSKNKFITVEFIVNGLLTIVKTATDSIAISLSQNLIIAANDCITLLLPHLDTKSQTLCNAIYALIDLEIDLIDDFSENTKISMLLLIAKSVKELSANLPVEFVDKLIGPSSDIIQLRHSLSSNVKDAIICVYKSLLNVKNVSVLQEAYRYVLGDFERFYKKLMLNLEPIIENNPFCGDDTEEEDDAEEDLESVIMFLLRCLSQLANGSSIIVLWVLKPGILDLVCEHLRPCDPYLAKTFPHIHYSILYLLFAHCKCYNHFISNSNLVANKPKMSRFAALTADGLVTSDLPSSSPNCENFTMIMKIIYDTLKMETSVEVTVLLLQWLNDILINSGNYLESFYLNEKFTAVIDIVLKHGYGFNTKILESVCDNLEKLLSNKQLSWSNAFLFRICDLCKLHILSNDANVRKCFTKLTANIPWDVAIVEFNKMNNVSRPLKLRKYNPKHYNSNLIHLARSLHLIGEIDSEMFPLQFKNFMAYLLNSKNNSDTDELENVFLSSWIIDDETPTKNMELFYNMAIASRLVLSDWCTWETAQFCVNHKLRTPLGKPIETFTKIELALNQLGNDLFATGKKTTMETINVDINRVRLLLHFIEHLDKSVYIASEGCAMIMLQPPKVVRSFFIANVNTCNEWFARISMVVMHLALHCGESSIALRFGQNILRDFVAHGKTATVDFERVAMFVTLALLNLKEPEQLYGLYAWCRNQTGQRYNWIKCAADQASKRLELALEGYQKILDEEKTKLEPQIAKFIEEQIVVCYKELINFVDLWQWHENYETVSTNSETNNSSKGFRFTTTNWECNKHLYNFETNTEALKDLQTWHVENTDSKWSVYDNLTATETNLYNVAIINAMQTGTKKQMCNIIEKNLTNIEKSIQHFLSLAPSEFLQHYFLLQYVASGLRKVAEHAPAHTEFLVSENFENEVNKIDSSVLRKILWWSEYFGKAQNPGFNEFTSNLRLDVIKRARKEKNTNLAIRNLFKFLSDKGFHFATNNIEEFNNMEFLERVSTDVKMYTLDVAKCMTEVIKVCYSNEEMRSSALNLSAIISTNISKFAELYNSGEHRKISSKILLKLAGWLQNNEQINLTEMNSALGKLIMVLPEIGGMESDLSNVIPLNEMAIGKLLQFSVHQCIDLPKNWNLFGTWCYKWGKKIVDHSADLKITLTEEHRVEIKALLPYEISDNDLNNIIAILSQTRPIIDEEDIDSSKINTSDMIRTQLQSIASLTNANEEQLQSLVQIWRNTQTSRIYNYYALSAESYFKYLHYTTNPENLTRSTEASTVTITLRLLRLIVKYALELQGILEEGLKTTPTQPWKIIIPQLFSRLNHPESYVRQSVAELLCRVAESAPQLITFPAVVGALEGGVKFEFGDIKLSEDSLSQNNKTQNNEDEEEEEGENDEVACDGRNDDENSNSSLQVCFKAMVDTLSKQDPETIAQVQTLVKELRRITLLWDELWLGALNQHQAEIVRRIAQLKYEIEKVNENSNLTKEEKSKLIITKYDIIIKPIVFVLDQLYNLTSVEPETPHEKQFQEKYLKEIKQAIHKLKNPSNPEKPQDAVEPLKKLQKNLHQIFNKKASFVLKLQDISPILYGIRNTVIAMPGLANSGSQKGNVRNVTIAHVGRQITVLPTKTKPKKLEFFGSDGRNYIYLFKGLEDLHLDERIMQFLSIANTMMAQNSDPSETNLYRARHYSVIPLGPRSGLISWVGGTTPIFSLYKRWQQRELSKPNSKGTTNTNQNAVAIPRPSDLFYNKLSEHGVKNMENRKEWSTNILKKVLTELMNETPSDLLARELWCSAVSANDWRQMVKTYSYSVAVMSMIGYIIGLGDRHLDNMLLDLTTGEVVHIDYNVCFEKGKTLRVPEKVPFRLTPNIKGALGFTGYEGIFRIASENVLKTLRKGRETLLTLLEAFVYDPLIDWTIGGEVLAGTSFGCAKAIDKENGRQNKKEMEREGTLAMFAVRCTEMKVEWQENKEEILNEIPKLLNILNTCSVLLDNGEKIEDQLQDLHQQLALVKEAEAQASLTKKHSLYKLPSLYDTYVTGQEAYNTAQKNLQDIIKDCNTQTKRFKEILNSFENHQYTKWLDDLKCNPLNDDLHVFDLVKEFLHNAGKDKMVTECEESEKEVNGLAHHLNAQGSKCIQLLEEYLSNVAKCPPILMENSRLHHFRKWSSYLLANKNTDACDEVFGNFRNFIDNVTTNQNAEYIINVAITLDAYYQETLIEMNKLFDCLAVIHAQQEQENLSLEQIYSQAKMSVATYLDEIENDSDSGSSEQENALKFVLASNLSLLTRNFLTLEVTAHRSGEYLIQLTTRDGDWFLDELLLHSSKAVEMLENVKLNNTNENTFQKILNTIKLSNAVYQGLYDLNFNFHTIILPETMKNIIADDDSVLIMMNELNMVINEADIPIPELIIQLEKVLTCVLMQMDVHENYNYLMEITEKIKLRYFTLIPTQSESLSHGKMLLMGFHGLFEKVNQEINKLAQALGDLNVPKSWKKLDYVKEAKNISPPIFNSNVQKILENIFILKRILTISMFFALAEEMCFGITCKNLTPLHSDEQLTKPIKQFIAEFITRQLLGVTPESITYTICYLLQDLDLDITHQIEQRDIGAESKVPFDELYNKSCSLLLKNGSLTTNAIAHVTRLQTNLLVAWDKMQEPKKIKQKLTMLQATKLRLQSQLTVHNFLFDDILLTKQFQSIREKLLVELRNEQTALQNIFKHLLEAKERQQKLIEKAKQRLNWAKGANPNMFEILAAFEQAVDNINQPLKSMEKIIKHIIVISGVIIKHEMLRSTTADSTKEYDQSFLTTCEKWRTACQYDETTCENLQPAEEQILGMLTNDIVNNSDWLQEIARIITENISDYQKRLGSVKESIFLEKDKLAYLVKNFKTIYNIHTKLMQDVKIELKAMMKIDDYSEATQCFIENYKIYLEHFNMIFNSFKEQQTEKMIMIEKMVGHLKYIEENTDNIYQELIDLQYRKESSKLAIAQQSTTTTTTAAVDDKLQCENKVQQQRNAYALNVWRRVKMKLEGRDPDPGRKSTPQEQVDYVIREATNLENLALLYEGWTPWV